MPRCYPPEPEFGAGRTAERRVWEVLREQLPAEATLLHSVPMIERAEEYEADLVVGWPGVGVAVIEVKGGHISRDNGRWYQSDRGGTHPIADPVVQAQDCKHVLHRLLVQYGSEAAAARFAHLVAFPFTGISPGWSYAGCPRDMILASSDLPAAAERIRAAVDRHGRGHAPLTSAGLESLLEVLEGQLPGQISLLSWAEENEAYVDQLTRDQARVMRILRMQRRLKVIGSAGTGKTWLALEHARLLAAAGQRVALVCYSRGLARFLERMTAPWPPAHRPAFVGLFHALPLAWGADPPPQDPDSVTSSTYYEERLPAQMGRLAARLGAEEKFDAIIVDEAQDFGAAWWPPTLACLRIRRPAGCTRSWTRRSESSTATARCRSRCHRSCWMRTSATPSRSPRCSGHSPPGRPGTAARTARRSGSCNAHQTRQSTRLTPRSTGSSTRAGSRDRLPCW
jgi:Nuclease-related domain